MKSSAQIGEHFFVEGWLGGRRVQRCEATSAGAAEDIGRRMLERWAERSDARVAILRAVVRRSSARLFVRLMPSGGTIVREVQRA